MTKDKLLKEIKRKQSFLCVGLDSEFERIPHGFLSNEAPQFHFNLHVMLQVHPMTVAFKINVAFYLSRGIEGFREMERTVNCIKEEWPEMFLIADAKVGDIGNTSKEYAKTYFKNLKFDAITINPYMGEDVVKPFLEYENKWAIILALTSNNSASDFQSRTNIHAKTLYESVITTTQSWGTSDQIMYVVGATKASELHTIRKLAPDHFFLVPGVGAQGGSLEEVSAHGLTENCGLLVNSSRGIIFSKFQQDAARKLQRKMQLELRSKGII